MLGKFKSECSSQTMISVPPFLTKRNLLQTNIFRNRVTAPSYFATQSCLNDVPPETSVVRSSKIQSERPTDGGNKTTTVSSVEDRVGRNVNKTKRKCDEKLSLEHTSWGWSKDKAYSSSTFVNVKGGGGTAGKCIMNAGTGSSRISVPLKGDGERGKQSSHVFSDFQRSDDKMVSTDDDSMFVECDANPKSAENDFRDDCPVNYSRLNAAVEKEVSRPFRKSTVGDSFSQTSANILQRFCAGISHDASSPLNTSLAFCKTGINPDNVVREDDPLTRSRQSTSTSTYLNVAPVNELKKPDRSLDGMCAPTTQHYNKSRHFKRKLPVPLDNDTFPVDKTCGEISQNIQGPKRVHKENKTRDNFGRDEPNLCHTRTSGLQKQDKTRDNFGRDGPNLSHSRTSGLQKQDKTRDNFGRDGTNLSHSRTSGLHKEDKTRDNFGRDGTNLSHSRTSGLHKEDKIRDNFGRDQSNLSNPPTSGFYTEVKTGDNFGREQPNLSNPLTSGFHKEVKTRDNFGRDDSNPSHTRKSGSHKDDGVSQKIQELNNYNKRKMGPLNIAPQAKALNVAHRVDEAIAMGRQSLNSLNFYDVIDCKSKDVEELFNIQSSFETASSEASQVSFRSAMESNYYKNNHDRRGLHSEPRNCRSKSPSFYSGISSPSSSHRNSSLKFDPDVFKSTFSVSLENGSAASNNVRTDRAKNYSRDALNASLNSSADKMELLRKSGKCIDMYKPSETDRTPTYEITNQNEEYLFQVSSPKDVLMMSLQTFKGLNINDPRSRLDCEKFLGHKSTGEKLNNFIRSRTIFNSVSFVQSESFGNDVKNGDQNGELRFGVTKNEDAAAPQRQGQSILQCIYKSQKF